MSAGGTASGPIRRAHFAPPRGDSLRAAVAPRDVLAPGAGVAGPLVWGDEAAAVTAGVPEVGVRRHILAVRTGGGAEARVDPQRGAAVLPPRGVGERRDIR